MPALTQAFETFEKPGLVVSYKLSNVKVYRGALVGVNASGFLIPMTHATAGLRYVGIANDTVDNSAGAAGDRSVNVTKSGSFALKAASGYTPAVVDLGKEVYSLTDCEIQIATAGLTNQYKVGTIVAIESPSTGGSGARIRIDNYSL